VLERVFWNGGTLEYILSGIHSFWMTGTLLNWNSLLLKAFRASHEAEPAVAMARPLLRSIAQVMRGNPGVDDRLLRVI